MPFIEEDKFKLIQEDLDNSKLKREEAETELTKVQEDFSSFKKKSKITPILLGLLLGAALGATYYFYTNGGASMSSSDIAEIKKEESTRVIDSITRAQARAKRSGKSLDTENDFNAGNNGLSVADVKADISSGETIYSVQIGIFSSKNYPLLSSSTIPSTVTKDNGFFKYSIGLFETLNEAKYLKRELIKIGFKDAFIASYVDGERQKIHN